MGGSIRQVSADGRTDIVVGRSPLKARRVAYEQLHAYPDAVGALLLANAPLDATTVVHSARYTTAREEQRRRRLCETIKALGVRAAEISDGIVLEGKTSLETLVEVDSDDPMAQLMAVSAALGPVAQVTVASTAAAESRWGDAFRAVRNLFE